MLEMTELTLWQDVALKVRELQAKFDAFETENAELRDHLNVTVDTLNAVVKIINDQVIAREPTEDPDNPDSEDITHPVDRHHYLEEVYTDTQPTLSQVYTMYQSQPSDEEG